MQDVKKACELGEKALQDALDKLDDCDEETFRDAQSIIELLRENLALWKEEDEGAGDQWNYWWIVINTCVFSICMEVLFWDLSMLLDLPLIVIKKL